MDDKEYRITKFITNYNEVTAKFVAESTWPKLKPRPVDSAVVRGEAATFLEWAKSEKVDPLLFMMARHDGAKKRVPIKFLHDVNASFLEKYREWGEWRQSMRRLEDRMKASDDTDPDVKLVPLHEAVRLVLSDSPEVCSMSHDISGGWHPESKHCQACTEAKSCKSLLPQRTRRLREWRYKNARS